MQKYIQSSKTETRGAVMKKFFSNTNNEIFDPIIKEVLHRYNITAIDNDTWYPQQVILDILRDIGQKTSTRNLIVLGMTYIENTLFPPTIDSIRTGLRLLTENYHVNHRHHSASEGYEIRIASDDHIQMIDNNPYPHDTIYGYVWGICKRFSAQGEDFYIYRAFQTPENPDSSGAIYDIKLMR